MRRLPRIGLWVFLVGVTLCFGAVGTCIRLMATSGQPAPAPDPVADRLLILLFGAVPFGCILAVAGLWWWLGELVGGSGPNVRPRPGIWIALTGLALCLAALYPPLGGGLCFGLPVLVVGLIQYAAERRQQKTE